MKTYKTFLTLASLHPRGKGPRHPLDRRLKETQGWSGRCGVEKNLFDGDCGEIDGMKIGGGYRSTRRKPASAPLFSTTNPTWLDPGLNPGRLGGKPATNRLGYGAAWTIRYSQEEGSEGCFFLKWCYCPLKLILISCFRLTWRKSWRCWLLQSSSHSSSTYPCKKLRASLWVVVSNAPDEHVVMNY
jgi:hypothetical protein